ncbi:outer membrane protein OmpK [Acinetobacter gandensis]|uniref:outer membrane protein OmpK n=1 Tax=Acinetobacter gandensis TaxID=1443941 RepID=UPI00398962E1
MKFMPLSAAILCTISANSIFAAPIWQDFSITGLYGTDYQLIAKEDKQTTVTFEYASKHKYGDFFIFADRTHNDVNGDQTYFEASPRLSLGAVTGKELKFGPVKDVLLATTWEAGSNMDNFLYGIGFDFDVPYFQYAKLNLYKVNNDTKADDYQMTLTYAIPFKIGSESFLADAFLDWSTVEKGSASEMNWTSQYKWNVGQHISPDTRLYVGVEHSVWNNKYNIKGKDENNLSALVKYHF